MIPKLSPVNSITNLTIQPEIFCHQLFAVSEDRRRLHAIVSDPQSRDLVLGQRFEFAFVESGVGIGIDPEVQSVEFHVFQNAVAVRVSLLQFGETVGVLATLVTQQLHTRDDKVFLDSAAVFGGLLGVQFVLARQVDQNTIFGTEPLVEVLQFTVPGDVNLPAFLASHVFGIDAGDLTVAIKIDGDRRVVARIPSTCSALTNETDLHALFVLFKVLVVHGKEFILVVNVKFGMARVESSVVVNGSVRHPDLDRDAFLDGGPIGFVAHDVKGALEGALVGHGGFAIGINDNV